MPLRSLVVDDEPAARELLTEMLAAHPEIAVVGACKDAEGAIAAVAELRPDVLFVDIRMAGGTGFDVVEALPALGTDLAAPLVVFVTAYDEHAVRAFEAGALDYLLKPFDEERLAQTVARLTTQARLRRTARGGEEAAPAAFAALDALDGPPRPLRRLPMRVGERIQLVPVTAVSWFEAHGKYIRVHLVDAQGRAATFELRRTMQSLEQRLDHEQFVRVSRSAIVNVDHLLHAERWSHGEYLLVLRDGARVATTSAFRAGIQTLLHGR